MNLEDLTLPYWINIPQLEIFQEVLVKRLYIPYSWKFLVVSSQVSPSDLFAARLDI
jgi:hypothetical protein